MPDNSSYTSEEARSLSDAGSEERMIAFRSNCDQVRTTEGGVSRKTSMSTANAVEEGAEQEGEEGK